MATSPSLEITFPPLHRTQKIVALNRKRFTVLACGRRWGKTRFASLVSIEIALLGGRAWWVAPSYKMGAVGWRVLLGLSKQIPGVKWSLSDRLLTYPGGGTIQVRSGDEPESLRGEGLDLAVLDEAAFMKETVWTHAIRPALSDRQGAAIFPSTPFGHNWFWKIYRRGQDDLDRTWASFRFATADNPHIPADEIAEAEKALPQRVFDQEYLAAFLEDAGGVFRNVVQCATSTPIDGRADDDKAVYVAGVDVAAKVDFTVVSVFDAKARRQVYLDRFNRVEYPVLEDRLAAIHDRFGLSAMVVEENSIGQGVIDHLRKRGVPVQGFYTTNSSKQEIIQNLSSAFEHLDIEIIPDPIQTAELQAFTGDRLAGGSYKYGAPDGAHDDTVMAMAIAVDAIGSAEPVVLW